MIQLLLRVLQEYFADTDDPTPGSAWLGAADAPQTRDNERLLRIYARALVELARQLRTLTADVAAIKAKLGL